MQSGFGWAPPPAQSCAVSLYSVRRSCVAPYGCKVSRGSAASGARPSGPTLRRATGCKPRRWGFSRSAEGWALWVYDRWSSLPIATGGTCQLGSKSLNLLAGPPLGALRPCVDRARAFGPCADGALGNSEGESGWVRRIGWRSAVPSAVARGP